MIFIESKLKGAYIIEIERQCDERGFFARTFCKKEFDVYGIDFNCVQCNTSSNKLRGTLRGMHLQRVPHEEAKLVRCIRGCVYDVIVDLRKDSPSYLQWDAFELSESNGRAFFIPKGFAHGYQTLEDDSEVFYQVDEFYHPECAQVIRYDDTRIGIDWPKCERLIISAKDAAYSVYSSEF